MVKAEPMDEQVVASSPPWCGTDPTADVQLILMQAEYLKLQVALTEAASPSQLAPGRGVSCRDLSPFGY